MQQRNVIFSTNEIYHIYNRSIAKEQILSTPSQLHHLSAIINYYRYSQTLRFSEFKKIPDEAKQNYLNKIGENGPLVEIYAFSFMPNHFHFLLKQSQTDGIKKFTSIVQNSYAKYFNLRYHRHGGLFQSPFKGRWIETDEQFAHVSRYIHLNHVTSYIISLEGLSTYQFSSYADYMGNQKTPWVNTEQIVSLFTTPQKYQQFVQDQSEYQRTLAEIKDVIIE